jgi:hypothetical protein
MDLAGWRARGTAGRARRSPIALTEAAPETNREAGTTTLHFRLQASGAARLEALREARRDMIREEWTRGLEDGEPSLAEAVFSAVGGFWEVPIGEQQICREKLRTLLTRANRRLEDAVRRGF